MLARLRPAGGFGAWAMAWADVSVLAKKNEGIQRSIQRCTEQPHGRAATLTAEWTIYTAASRARQHHSGILPVESKRQAELTCSVGSCVVGQRFAVGQREGRAGRVGAGLRAEHCSADRAAERSAPERLRVLG